MCPVNGRAEQCLQMPIADFSDQQLIWVGVMRRNAVEIKTNALTHLDLIDVEVASTGSSTVMTLVSGLFISARALYSVVVFHFSGTVTSSRP